MSPGVEAQQTIDRLDREARGLRLALRLAVARLERGAHGEALAGLRWADSHIRKTRRSDVG